jgi:GNAT superfamily N-acetyltransferase
MLSHIRSVALIGIRSAVPGDLPALRGIFRRSSLSNEGDREALLANPEALELPDDGVTDARTRVAVAADGTVLGFVTGLAVDLDGSVLELEDLFVDPDWMRKGVARRLMADLTATARLDGIACIQVTANPHADAFYRSVGFVHLHDTETQFGPGARMQLAVPSEQDTPTGSVSSDA